jgi:hypothetical protein
MRRSAGVGSGTMQAGGTLHNVPGDSRAHERSTCRLGCIVEMKRGGDATAGEQKQHRARAA